MATAGLWLLSAIATTLLGIVLTILFSDRIASLLARLTSLGAPGSRDPRGLWATYYVVVPDHATSSTAGQPSRRIEMIRLRRFGKRVVGRNERLSRHYVIRGVVDDRAFLTGTWADTSHDRNHLGGFQLSWESGGRYMVGKFVGKDSHNHVNHGLWLWARDDPATLTACAEHLCKDGGYGPAAARLRDELRLVTAPSQAHTES